MINVASVYAQEKEEEKTIVDTSETKVLVSTPKRFYMGNGYDFLMLSSAIYDNGIDNKITIPRFTGVVNLGVNFHFDPNKRIGFFTGIGLKNLGFIEKNPFPGAVTNKYRVYTIGVPIGLKIGDLRNRNFLFGGGGVDFPFHYKVKTFSKIWGKSKDSEWFNEYTPRVMPYVFLGVSIDPGFIIKAQYYPNSFFNQDYETWVNGTGPLYKPFDGWKANIFALCLSIDIHYNQYKIQEREYRKWKAEQNALKN